MTHAHSNVRLVRPDDSGVVVMTLARADKRNALTPQMLDDLALAITMASPVARCILLTGEGDVFCAGFDLSLCRDDAHGATLRSLLKGLSHCIRLLRDAPCPVVVSAHGAAVAGGCALLGGSDDVVTTHTAKLGYPVVRLGIAPAVSAPSLVGVIGPGPARARLLDTQLVSGERAVQLGLASESFPDAPACEARALERARAFARKPAHAMQATKALLNQLDEWTKADAQDRALAASLALVGGPEEQRLLPQAWAAKPSQPPSSTASPLPPSGPGSP